MLQFKHARRGLLIVGALILLGIAVHYFSSRPLTPEEWARVDAVWNPPPKHKTRGPAPSSKGMMTAGLVATTISLDSETVTVIVGLMTALTLLFALLSKHLIGPMIDKKFELFRKEVVTRDIMNAHEALDESRHEEAIRRHDDLVAAINSLTRRIKP